MFTMEHVASNSPRSMKIAARVVIGALAGAAFGGALVKLLLRLHVSLWHASWSDGLALWLGVSFLGIGLIMAGVSFNRREVARNLEGREAKLPATDEEVRAVRLQGATLVLAGIMLMLPLMAMGSLGMPAYAPQLFYAGIVLLFALQTAANAMLWRCCDEFLRRQILLTAAIAFAIGQGALFLWAAAEHLHLAPAISSWDIVTLLMAGYLAIGGYIAVRSRPTRY
jgi:MFS family permease